MVGILTVLFNTMHAGINVHVSARLVRIRRDPWRTAPAAAREGRALFAAGADR
jgi:hypothetical protein